MKLSMTGEYAIRAVLHLSSKSSGELVHISDISKIQDIPETLLRKIIGQLVKLGFIHSSRGTGGGIRLARSPKDITLLDVIEGIEGKIFLNRCLIGQEFCHRTPYCAVHRVWCEVQSSLVGILGSKTMADLATENERRFKNYKKSVDVEVLIEG